MEFLGGVAFRRALRAAGLGLALWSGPAAAGPVPALPALCRRVDAAWVGVTTFQANLKWPNPASRREQDQGCGLFLYQKPNRWLLEFHTPRFEKYLIKADTGWVYVARLKQAVRYKLKPGERAQVGVMILGQPTSQLTRFYNLTSGATPADRRAMLAEVGPALTLEPRNGASLAIRRAVMFFDPASYLPRKIRIQLESGDDLRISLELAKKNQRLDPSVWNFALPESTAILER